MNYFSETSKLDKQVRQLLCNVKQLKIQGVSDARLDSYAKNYIKKCNSQTIGTRSLEDYITNRLNEKEKELYKKNRAKALLCMANGVLAINFAEANYEERVLYGGNGDAFRHTLWCYGMVVDVGHSFAKKWSNAHEYGDEEQPLIVRKMDLYNNKIGLKLGKKYPNTVGWGTFVSRTKNKVSKGKCRRIVNNELVRTNKDGLKE